MKPQIGATVLAAIALAVAPAGAGAQPFTAACSGTAGDVASFKTAIASANAAPGPDTIELGTGCTYSLTTVDNNWYGPNGLPPIASDITIDGNGATLTRDPSAPSFRFFFVGADPTSTAHHTENYVSPGPGVLTLNALTVTGGRANGGGSAGGGGGAGMGGAIFSQGTVRISRSTLTDNQAQGGSAVLSPTTVGFGGGGIGTSSGKAVANAGGFGPGTFGGNAGGTPSDINAVVGSGGAGFRTDPSDAGTAGTAAAAAPGGGVATGLGGAGATGSKPGGAAGDGSGGGGGHLCGGNGGAFGVGGQNCGGGGGGGVGGGGGFGSAANCAGGGGGFGGGGGGIDTFSALNCRGGNGGFGGGGGGGSGTSGSAPGAPGFGGGTPTAAGGGGGAGMGGAIFTMQGELTISASTFTNDRAVGGADAVTDHGKGIGGAVFNLNGAVTIVGSTFAANAADFDGSSIYNLAYDGAVARSASMTLRDTIVSGGAGPGKDLASETGTFITPTNKSTALATIGEGDLVRTTHALEPGTISGTALTADPQLGLLQNNGGPTATMLPATTSPVLDTGSAFGLITDQRGQPRPFDFVTVPNLLDGADIGAVEIQPLCPTAAPGQACGTLTVTIGGSGAGTVSDGRGISCPGACRESDPTGTGVTLTATPAPGSTFDGFSGACSGTASCPVTLDADKSVVAVFVANSQPPPPDHTAPVITSASASPSTFAVDTKGKRETAVAAATKRKPKPAKKGTTLRYTLSEAARVLFTVEQSSSGRTVGKTCAKATAKNRKRKKCARYTRRGRFALSATSGAGSHHFTGRIGSTTLKPGRYRMTLTATDVAHNTSKAKTFTFKLVKR